MIAFIKLIFLISVTVVAGCAAKIYQPPSDEQKAKIIINPEINRRMDLSLSASARYLIYKDEKCKEFPNGYILGSDRITPYVTGKSSTFEGQIPSGHPIILTHSFESSAIDMKTIEYCAVSIKFTPIKNYTYFSKFLVEPASCKVILTSTNGQVAKEIVMVENLIRACKDY